jgi:hypothetical protein
MSQEHLVMTYRGRIKNGVVVLDASASLPEGSEVEVSPLPDEKKGPTLSERYKNFVGSLDGLPKDMAENHDHYIHGAPKRPT